MEAIKSDRYEIHPTIIGKGAYSEVYAGYDNKLDRKVAVKKLLHTNAGHYEQWVMKNYGKHPFLLELYDFFIEDKNVYIVTELIEGRQLCANPRNNAAIKAMKKYKKNAVQISIKILEGLKHLHEQNFLHTDIAPQNIMLVGKGPKTIKIIDFGGAVQKDKNGVYFGKRYCGSNGYIESFKKLHKIVTMDNSTDIYSTACVCLSMLTGKKPFSPSDICEEVKNNRLKHILLKATSQNKNDRYNYAQDMINDLRN